MNARMLLFMTPGVGLKTWERIGSLQRETKVYRSLLQRGVEVAFLTFDDRVLGSFEGIRVLRFPSRFLLPALPVLAAGAVRWATILKTNQSYWALPYVLAAKVWRKPVWIRCGYVHGEQVETLEGPGSARTKLVQRQEKLAFNGADVCSVPTTALKRWLVRRYGTKEERIRIQPNFVDTDLFSPRHGLNRRKSIVVVARLAKEKRIDWVIRAGSIANAELTVFGVGAEREHLERVAKQCHAKVHFAGNVTQEELAAALPTFSAYVSASEWEGHPKAMLEAMACGLPLIGTRTKGIEDLIKDGETGLLCENSIESLGAQLKTVLGTPEMAARLARDARREAEERFGFPRFLQTELDIITELLDIGAKRKRAS